MADDFGGCPNTGGEKPCNPLCLLFVRNHSSLKGKHYENYCRKYGQVDRSASLTRLNQEEGDIENGS